MNMWATDKVNEVSVTGGISGLTVEESGNRSIPYRITYEKDMIPRCPYDDAEAKLNGFTKPKDITDEVFGETFRAEYKQRRYICPTCGKEIVYESPYIRPGASTSRRMDQYIAKKALYYSYDDVVKSTKLVSRIQVKRIFETWAAEQIQEYIDSLEAPEHLGVHIVGNGKNQYFLLSDLDSDIMLDILPLSSVSYRLVDLLGRLKGQKVTNGVCTDIDPTCFMTVKALYDSPPSVDVSVARASVYYAYARAVHDAVEKHYSKKYSKKLFLSLISTPLSEEIQMDDQRKMVKLGEKEAFLGVDKWIESLLLVRKMIHADRWTQSDYNNWIGDVSVSRVFKDLIQYLHFADLEIQRGFKNLEQHRGHEANTKMANRIIMLNQKCSFEVLRARMLLTSKPKLAKNHKWDQTSFYAGISMKALYEDMEHILLGGAEYIGPGEYKYFD